MELEATQLMIRAYQQRLADSELQAITSQAKLVLAEQRIEALEKPADGTA